MKFRKLKAEEIDVKVGSVNSKGYTLLLYKNARVDMAILDETVGVENWQNKFYEVVGNLYCSLGININYDKPEKEPYWIWKDDCGVESNFGDKEKGQASDARKRAGFAWGIGRELYTSPFIFIPCTTEYNQTKKCYEIVSKDEKDRRFIVKDIQYKDDEISYVVITDTKGIQVYPKAKLDESKIVNSKEQVQEKIQTNNNTTINTKSFVAGGDYTLTFGKFKSKTIREVYENEEKGKDYIAWLEENGDDEVSANINEFRNQIEKEKNNAV